MHEALALARMGWGLTSPNPMVGAVIVRDGEIIGRGYHCKAGEAHAEINALRDVAKHGIDPAGSTMYVTLEPCSTHGRTGPCTEAIKKAGIRRVVIGALDPNPKHSGAGVELLREAGIEVTVGVERNAAGIDDARENALVNDLSDQSSFIAEDATSFMLRAASEGAHVDVLAMDPPRAGSTPEFIRAAASVAPRRIVYISCNPVTQARDLEAFAEVGYRLSRLTPVDMFPHTDHVETVATLER